MVRAASPDHAPPALDIKLHQNPNAFFFPASTISGHVIYTNHHGNADYDLRLMFRGSNIVAASSGSDHATLFEYNFNLHTARKGRNHKLANSQVDVAPMTFPFKHRFPAATDNRSFGLAGDTLTTKAFNDHVHDLPPSFSSHVGEFQCSVSYNLQAELYHDNFLLCQSTLPIMFLPYARLPPSNRNGSILSGCQSRRPLTLLRKDSLIDNGHDSPFDVSIHLPGEISAGLPFKFEVQVQLPFWPEYGNELPNIQILVFKLVITTQCRLLGEKQDLHRKTKTVLLHPLKSTCSIDSLSSTIRCVFHATLSSYYPPSFRSFLVSNTYVVEAPIQLTVDGRTIEAGIRDGEVVVLSPITQQADHRRIITMRNTGLRTAACNR